MLPSLAPFFESNGWTPFSFQTDTWEAYREGKSGLVHAPTGLGKTFSVWLGPVSEAIESQDYTGCQVLWITPLRALAVDTQKSLQEPLASLGSPPIEIGIRTGDSSSYQKSKLNKKLPFCLITTPESLSLFLTHANFRNNLAGLRTIIIDEWHELLGTKRGVQTELCLSRLRRWFPSLRTWGLSATLGNTQTAMEVLLGSQSPLGVSIQGVEKKKIEIETLLPKEIDRFPWAGHIGTQLVKQVVSRLEGEGTTLLFTNTRSQTEIWFQEILSLKPEWADELAIHHGSLDHDERLEVERRLRDGEIRAVVCTSSLDLGVDFSPVSQVIQVGSPKGIARLMQRAGRSGHHPGGVARLACVPTNALEILEFTAAQRAINERKIESRLHLQKPLDVLVQHLVTCCIGEPLPAADLRAEISSSYAYRELNDAEWQWAIEFITMGGPALKAYPNYQKVITQDGKLTVLDKKLIQMHRLSIGTITSHPHVSISFQGGRVIGTVEESFLTKVKEGGVFIFAGYKLELVRLRAQKATVKKATKSSRGDIPIWNGGRMPLSTELAHAVSETLQHPNEALPEIQALSPIFSLQRQWSILPHDEIILIEQTQIRGESHLFLYTFAGRAINEGLGSLVAWRINQEYDIAIQMTMNDYGFSLCGKGNLPFSEVPWRKLLSTHQLQEDLIACMNTAELARRQFRDIARVSGLVLQNLPNKNRKQKELQISSRLLYEVFERYDPENLLLNQARREILENQLEFTRLRQTMESLQSRPLRFMECERLTPMAFPLWADRLHAHHHAGDATTRLEKMLLSLEQAAG